MRKLNLLGQRFGRLVVIKECEPINKHSVWLCKCDCGNVKKVQLSSLRRGLTTSCGCKQKEIAKANATRHGHHADRLYPIWKSMKQRCYNPNTKDRKYYKDSDVTVCNEWLNDYNAFREWAYANGYDENAKFFDCTLDRINPFGNYEPSNCRWVNNYTQQHNKKKDWKGEQNGRTPVAD